MRPSLFTRPIFRLLDYVLFGCIWIAVCAFCLALESLVLLRLDTSQPALLCFVTAATFAHYNLHYWSKGPTSTPRGQWTAAHPAWHASGIVIGVLVTMGSAWFLTATQWLILGPAAFLALLYSLPLLPSGRRFKQLGLFKVVTLSLVWTLITVALPGYTAYQEPLFWFMIGRRLIFMLVLCLAFDIRDDETDSAASIRTFPVRFGRRATYVLMDGLLAVFIVATCVLGWQGGLGYVAAAMMLSALLTRWAVHGGKHFTSERYYLAIVDGMMPLQAMLVILAAWYFPSAR